jgi:hypothetical protein
VYEHDVLYVLDGKTTCGKNHIGKVFVQPLNYQEECSLLRRGISNKTKKKRAVGKKKKEKEGK